MNLDPMRVPAIVVAIAFAALAPVAAAQDRASDPDRARPSVLQPAIDRLDADLQAAVTAGDDAASHWIAGQRETLDPAARVRQFGAATAREPSDRLYAASLARACLQAARTPPECDIRDALAYWASRDADNAAPWLLLAARAVHRRSTASALENLDRAARAARFDDYTQTAATLLGRKFAMLPDGRDPVLVALATHRLLGAATGGFAPILGDLCGPERTLRSDTVTADCLRIAALLVERAPNDADRAVGAALAVADAPTPSARAVADRQAAAVALDRQRCSEVFARLEEGAGRAAGDAAKARDAVSRWLTLRAAGREKDACAALATALDLPPR